MHANQLCTEIDSSVFFRKPALPSLLSRHSYLQLCFLLQRWLNCDFVMQINNDPVKQNVNWTSQKLYKIKKPPHNIYTRWFKVQKNNGLAY